MFPRNGASVIVVAMLIASMLVLVTADYGYDCPTHVVHQTKTVKIPQVKVIKVPYKVYIPIKEEKSYEHKSYGHDHYKK